jgi:uncharacterized membrane protein
MILLFTSLQWLCLVVALAILAALFFVIRTLFVWNKKDEADNDSATDMQSKMNDVKQQLMRENMHLGPVVSIPVTSNDWCPTCGSHIYTFHDNSRKCSGCGEKYHYKRPTRNSSPQ